MNIYDIAAEAGVSPATVSRVVNGKENVKEETRKKILDIIEEKNYVPNSIARNLSVGGTSNIALLAPDIENPFFGKILHGLSDTANQYGYNVFMYGTNDDIAIQHRILDSIRTEKVKGVVIIPVSYKDEDTADQLRNLEKDHIPVVLLDRDIEQGSFDGVFSNDYEGTLEALQCLIDAGHRKIAIVAGNLDSRPGRERMRGYEGALSNAGIERREEYIVYGSFKEKDSYEACEQLLGLEDRPTAIFTSNNLTTLGVLKCLKDHHLKVGQDISVVGFDEISELACTDIQLTVVDRPIYEMGCAALELLEYNFEAPQEQKIGRRTDEFPANLILRGSERLA